MIRNLNITASCFEKKKPKTKRQTIYNSKRTISVYFNIPNDDETNEKSEKTHAHNDNILRRISDSHITSD